MSDNQDEPNAGTNTADNTHNAVGRGRGKPFVKGDPRIWRYGRPKSFDALRNLAKEIAAEKVKRDDKPVVIDGHAVTVTEAILRQWAQSKNPLLQKSFIEVAYGKVPDVHELTGKNGKPIEFIEVEHVGNSDPDDTAK